MAVTNECPYCRRTMTIARMACSHCQVDIEADFPASRLGGLPTEHQRFIELFVLSGGSLKQMAEHAGVSYPTVRSRLDRVIETLRAAIEQPSAGKAKSGEPTINKPLTSEEAARLIKAI